MKNKDNSYDLNALVETYDIDNAYEQYKRLEFLKKLSNYLSFDKSTVLELGSASGEMALLLAQNSKQVVAVDGSSKFIKIARERTVGMTNIIFYEAYFETMNLNKEFDCLVLDHVLEHVEIPFELLIKAKNMMHTNSIMAISVPNAHALSRQLAVKMGLLKSVYELTENDKRHGHFRVYDWQLLEELVNKSGFTIIGKHGLSFKLFSDKQMLELLNIGTIGEQQVKGLWELGDSFPELAGVIMLIVKKRE